MPVFLTIAGYLIGKRIREQREFAERIKATQIEMDMTRPGSYLAWLSK